MPRFKFYYEVVYDGTTDIVAQSLIEASDRFAAMPSISLITDVSKAVAIPLKVESVKTDA